MAAHRRLRPNDAIPVKLELGTLNDVRWASLGVNKDHGLRRTNSDKRNAIVNALKPPKGAELSDRQIGKLVGVHHNTVSHIRRDMELSGEIRQSNIRTGLGRFLPKDDQEWSMFYWTKKINRNRMATN
ncbi:MAG: hypothetical protein LBG58_06700 [Planctomycetaceae bacterium]|nr:hypothetical protein [Planctomycetaceae bacterium]